MKLKYLFVFVVLMSVFVSANYEEYVLSVPQEQGPFLRESINYFKDVNNLEIKKQATLQEKVIVMSVADGNPLAKSTFGVWKKSVGYWEVKEFGDDIFVSGTTEQDLIKAVQSLNEKKSPKDSLGVLLLIGLLSIVFVGVYFFIKLNMWSKIFNKNETSIQKYFRKMRKKGFNDDKIRKSLLSAGWKNEDLKF